MGEIGIGDVVSLKSGSIVMTVNGISGSGDQKYVACVWLSEDKEPMEQRYHVDALRVKATENE